MKTIREERQKYQSGLTQARHLNQNSYMYVSELRLIHIIVNQQLVEPGPQVQRNAVAQKPPMSAKNQKNLPHDFLCGVHM